MSTKLDFRSETVKKVKLVIKSVRCFGVKYRRLLSVLVIVLKAHETSSVRALILLHFDSPCGLVKIQHNS